MKAFKRFTALVLTLVMAAMLAVSAYAATVVVKYKVYVYTSQLTFKQYDYSSSTTPSTRNLTILADSSLGSGSALYHVKYVNGAVFGYWRRRIVWHMFSIWHGPCFSYEYAFFKAAASESASGGPL